MKPSDRLYYHQEPLYNRPPEFRKILWRNPPRKLFLDAITRVTPEIVERLITDVGPLYPKSKTSREHTLSFSDLWSTRYDPETEKELRTLKEALIAWTSSANLAPNDWYPGRFWLPECGLYTLAIHAGYLEPPTDEAIAVKLPPDCTVSLTLEPDGTVTLNFKAPNPYVNDIADRQYFNTRAIITAMNFYFKQLRYEYDGLCFGKSSTDKSLDHWEWLALHLVRGWTYDDIADEYVTIHGNPVDSEHVGKIVRKNRAAIGFDKKQKLRNSSK